MRKFKETENIKTSEISVRLKSLKFYEMESKYIEEINMRYKSVND